MLKPGKTPTLLYWLIALIGLFSSYTQAALDLNGLAVHTELKKDQYIAALYLEELGNDHREILLGDQRKRMEIKVVANRLLSRKFKRQWIEGVAINAGNSELTKHAQNLADFSNLLKVKLIRNDTLTIERTFRRGVRVSINGVFLGSIADKTFFDLLLRAWIGPVPPSSSFKQALLGRGVIDPGLLARFKSLRATPERVATLQEAITGNNERQIAATRPPIPVPEPTPIPVPVPAPAITPTIATPSSSLTEQNQEADLPPSIENEPQASEPEVTGTSEPVESNTENAQPPIAIAAPEARDSTNNLNAAIPTLESASSAEESVFADDEDEDVAFTAADLLSRQLYISQLTRWTRRFIVYPQRAVNENHEGSARVTVVIDNQGKVITAQLSKETDHSTLNNAALQAIREASPFPKIPSSIQEEQFTFTVPITFALRPTGS